MEEEKWSLPVAEQKTGNPDFAKTRKFEKLSTFDWLQLNKIVDVRQFRFYEVSYKDGSRKEFAVNSSNLQIITGDWVVVDTGNGYDIGKISLSGDLVRLQMKKRKVSEERELNNILRIANTWEVEKLDEIKNLEYSTLVRARAIAASLGLDMKIGEVEYQADRRKATFFYTSEDRVDFRDLVKEYAREFKVKIEMRQIGIRQESSKIGGIGSCGRELCCSTWHTNFTSVTTDMVRYQNLSVNQSKLTGLCGRLKCCLNYELDIYLEALEDFPKDSNILELEYSKAYFVKLDIFKGLMYYTLKNEKDRNKIYALSRERVTEIISLNKQGKKPADLGAVEFVNTESSETFDFEDVTGQIELKEIKRNKKKKKKPAKPNFIREEKANTSNADQQNKGTNVKPEHKKETKDHGSRPPHSNQLAESKKPDDKTIQNPQDSKHGKNKMKFRRYPKKNKNQNKNDGQ